MQLHEDSSLRMREEISRKSQDLKDSHVYISSVELSKKVLTSQIEEQQQLLCEIKKDCADTLKSN